MTIECARGTLIKLLRYRAYIYIVCPSKKDSPETRTHQTGGIAIIFKLIRNLYKYYTTIYMYVSGCLLYGVSTQFHMQFHAWLWPRHLLPPKLWRNYVARCAVCGLIIYFSAVYKSQTHCIWLRCMDYSLFRSTRVSHPHNIVDAFRGFAAASM